MGNDLESRNRKTVAVALLVVLAMTVLAFSAAPLYRKFCQVTGWGGTTQVVAENPFKEQAPGRVITVRFNADTDPALPWDFRPDLVSVDVRLGQDGFITFTAKNESSAPATGTAIYNVTPLKAGKYFYKTQCFCFGSQTLQPGQEMQMPVAFFVDPAILEDYDLKDLTALTLSYTFYEQDTPAAEAALENFTKTQDTP